jgi:hypothetical protein
MTAGSYSLIVEDDDENQAGADFAVLANASLSNQTTPASPGHVGSEVTMAGTGFLPDTAVMATYTSEPVLIGSTTTDSNGSFTITGTIPASEGGKHTITVSDNTNSLTFDFYMEQDAPNAPALLSPDIENKTEQPVTFSWQSVQDESGPVTYTLQISQDSTFTALLIPEKVTTNSSYQLTEEEKLASTGKDEPFYWRVKATDAAGNEGDWSTAGTFYTSSGLGIGAWFIIIGIGLILILSLGFVWGRRSNSD